MEKKQKGGGKKMKEEYKEFSEVVEEKKVDGEEGTKLKEETKIGAAGREGGEKDK